MKPYGWRVGVANPTRLVSMQKETFETNMHSERALCEHEGRDWVEESHGRQPVTRSGDCHRTPQKETLLDNTLILDVSRTLSHSIDLV